MREADNYLPDLSSIRGELRVLNISVFLMIVFAALSYIALFRLLGVSGIQEFLLVAYRAIDLIIILAFLIFCGSRVKLRRIDFLLLIFIIYPLLIGLFKNSVSMTFLNDVALFSLFFIKIIVLRTTLYRVMAVVDIDKIFRKSARKIVLWCALLAVTSLGTAIFMLGRGEIFYYQAPAEITFAAAMLLAQGKIFGYLFFLALAFAAGKRMVMVGVLFMALFAALTHPRLRRALIRFSGVALVLAPLALILGGSVFSADLTVVDKLLGTYRQLARAMEMSDNFFDTLMYLDPPRFSEYVSLKPHLTGWSLWFGNGYGFRYELDTAFLEQFGYIVHGDVTNAHFTPLAITAKFGLFGLLIWLVLIVTVMKTSFDRRSFVQTAARLAFVSMIVQSFFAFGFFVNIYTPFYIAMATLGRRRRTQVPTIAMNRAT